MVYQTLRSLLDLQLQELYAAETHLAREFKHYVDGAASAELKSQLSKHKEETEQHAEGLASLLQKRSLDFHGVTCRVMDTLIKRGGEIIQSRGDDTLLDLGLVLTMRSIDTLEYSWYENAKTIAEALGEEEVVRVLERYLREEGQQECSWTVLAEDMVDALVATASKAKHQSIERAEGAQQ
jgi:ferritin-like metal-binding protein YciE